MDAIALLVKDHRTVKALFARFEKLGDGAMKEKKAVVAQISRELAIHAAIEEALFYPTARKALKAKEDLVLEALEEHHVVKLLLQELEGLDPSHERFDAKVKVLIEAVEQHVREEEKDLFPAFQRKVSGAERAVLGRALEAAKKVAPTRPHPRAPDAPPANLLASIPSALLDRVRDLVAAPARTATARASHRGAKRMTVPAAMKRIGRRATKATTGKKAPSAKRRSARTSV
jgi:hemerythrin superfamily protein